MAESIQVFKHKPFEEPAAVVQYLETLIQGICSGELKLGSGEDEIDLQPGGQMRLRVRARRNKKGQERIQFNISWNRAVVAKAGGEPLNMNAPKKSEGKQE